MNKDMSARKIRQEKLAKLFLEMGMDENLVEKISGVSKERFKNNYDCLKLTINGSNSNMFIEK